MVLCVLLSAPVLGCLSHSSQCAAFKGFRLSGRGGKLSVRITVGPESSRSSFLQTEFLLLLCTCVTVRISAIARV